MTTLLRSFMPRLTLLAILAAIAASVWAPSVSAQGPGQRGDNEFFLYDPDNDLSGSLTDTQGDPQRVGGFGLVGRAGHVVGPTVGRSDSVTYTDLMPYVFIDQTMLFGDLKFNLGNNGHIGGSAGLGMRQYFNQVDAVGGLMIAYDHDATRSANFEQLVIANEWLSEFFDVRTNIYLPFGRQQFITSTILEPGSEEFTDFNITFQRRSFSSTAMRGGEQLYTVPVPGELAQAANLEATAGWYHYQAPGSEMVWGYKLQADADFFERLLHTTVTFTGDGVFGQNIIFSADVNYWNDLQPRRRVGQSQYNRMANWVRRNRTVVSDDSSFLNPRELARKADGTPYLVYHVRNRPGEAARPGVLGSIDDPFYFMQEGIDQLPFADIVFVHSDSVFDGTTPPPALAPNVVLRSDVQVLGEGVTLTLPVLGLTDEITVPTANDPVGDVPLITNVTGNAVTFASDSRFSGFRITNVMNGTALNVGASTNGRIDEVTIDNVTGTDAHGISFNGASGVFAINGLSISDLDGNGTITDGNAFQVLGGAAAITVGRPANSGLIGGANLIENTSGFSVLVEDAAGSLFFRDMAIADTGGLGLAVRGTTAFSSSANVTFDSATLTGTNPGGAAAARAAVQVFNHSGAVVFQDDLTITSNNGIGIDLNTLSPTATFTSQGDILIDDRNDIGIRMVNFSEGGPIPGSTSINQATRATFLGNVNINANVVAASPPPGTPNSPAVFYNTQAGAALFGGNLIVDGSAGDGIVITNPAVVNPALTTGQFRVNGFTQVDNVFGTSLLVQDIGDDDFRLTFNGIQVGNRGDVANGVGGVGIRVQRFAGDGNFRGITTINNQLNVGAVALDVNNITQAVAFTAVTVNDQVGPGPAVSVTANRNPVVFPATTSIPAVVSFGEIQVLNATGITGVVFDDNDNVTVNTGTIDVTTGQGISITNNTRHDVTFESISASNGTFGIQVLDSTGRFEVTGNPINGPAQGSGGTISGMTSTGAIFQNTNLVRLAGVDFDANNVGIAADLMLVEFENLSATFELETVRVMDSLNQGVIVRDVLTTNVFNSEFDNNGSTTVESQFEWGATFAEFDVNADGDLTDTEDQFNTVATGYNLTIQNSRFTDPGGAAIIPGNVDGHLIHIHSGDTGFFVPARGDSINDQVVLNLIMGPTNPFQDDTLGNFIISNRQALSTIHVAWDGSINASINDNLIDMQTGTIAAPADTATALFMDIDGEADVVFQRNTVIARGDFATGLDLNFNSATNLQISDNVRFDDQGNFIQQSGFEFQGVVSTAMNLTFNAANNNIFIENNLVDFVNFGINGDGIIFNRLVGPSTVTINNNLIQMLSNGGLTEGIIFRRNEGVIALSGQIDNIITVQGTNNFFVPLLIDFDVVPIGSTTGSIIVNGTQVP
ncbi:MAG: hypothetical protein R3C18_15460 [Planctomycetaceae bacterium]